MSVKPTTAIFSIREAADASIDFNAGQSETVLQTVQINTNLDTLNREVLLIQEIDFDIGGLPYFMGVMARNGGSNSPTDFFANGSIQAILTEVDPAVDPNALGLSSPHFIASASVLVNAGAIPVVDLTPDTATYNSQAGEDHPLFTTASESLFLTLVLQYSGNDPAAGTASPPNMRGSCRILCQRGKADADTYAAILTGLFQ